MRVHIVTGKWRLHETTQPRLLAESHMNELCSLMHKYRRSDLAICKHTFETLGAVSNPLESPWPPSRQGNTASEAKVRGNCWKKAFIWCLVFTLFFRTREQRELKRGLPLFENENWISWEVTLWQLARREKFGRIITDWVFFLPNIFSLVHCEELSYDDV